MSNTEKKSLISSRIAALQEAKGYTVTYSEYMGGHHYICWRGSFADGLLALIGKKE